MKGLWAAFFLAAFLFSAAQGATTITGLSTSTFKSCDFADIGLQFKILGSDLNSAKCIFRNIETGEITNFVAVFSSPELLCSVSSPLVFGEYKAGIRMANVSEISFPLDTSDLQIEYDPVEAWTDVYYLPETLAVDASFVDPASTSWASFSTSPVAQDLTFKIFPYSTCGSIARCDEGGDLKFLFEFDDHPEFQVTLTSEIDGTCTYTLPAIFTKGTYGLSISYNGTFMDSTTFDLIADFNSLNQSQAIIDTSLLGTVTAGTPACVDVTLYDSYNNTIDGVLVSLFSLIFNGTAAQGKTLGTVVDGVYPLCFTPTKSGSQSLTIRVNGLDLHGSPVPMTVQPGPLSATRSQIRSAVVCPSNCAAATPVVGAISGVPFHFTIVPRDAYSNLITTPSPADLPSFSGSTAKSGGPTYPATFSIVGNYFRATFTALIHDQYLFSASFGGVPLDTGSTPTVTVTAGPVDVESSEVNTTARTVSAGGSFSVLVIAKDLSGNVVTGATGWTAALDDALNCPVTEVGGGAYQATCSPTIAKDSVLVFSYNSVAHSSQVDVVVTPGGVSASMSTFQGFPSTMSCNTTGTLIIVTKDSYGNVGGTVESFQRFQTQLQIVEDGNIVSRVTTNTATLQDGTTDHYLVSFFLVAAGNYTVTILFNGAAISTSLPPYVFVNPSSTVASKCTLENVNSPIAGTPVLFDLVALDIFDNVQFADERDLFQINAIKDEITVPCSVGAPSVDHIYTVSCPLTVVGSYQVLGTFSGSSIVGAFILLLPGPISATTSSFSTLSNGYTRAVAGQATLLVIQGRDSVNNKITISEDYDVVITSAGKKRSVIPTEKVINDAQAILGLSYYTYVTQEAGDYTVSVMVNGSHIHGSPSPLVVNSAPALSSTLEFDAGASLSYEGKVGNTIQIRVYLKDQFNNSVTGLDSLTASLVGTDFAGIATTTPTLTADGYLLSFPVTIGGVYSLNLIVNGVSLNNSITVAAFSSSGGACTNFEGPINQGNEWTLVCTAYDVYGKEKNTGGDEITWDAPEGVVRVVDNEDGQYAVTYMSQTIGTHSLTVRINSKEVPGMPLTVEVIPGAVVLGTVIPAIFVLALIVVCTVYYLKRKREKEQLLLKKKRKPQQIFKPIDEGEWMDDDMEQEEEWFDQREGAPADLTEKMNNAHNRVMSELELH